MRVNFRFGFELLAISRGYLPLNKIGVKRRTQGTEISKYLKERTSTETPLVVTSERGPGQCSCETKWNTLESVALEGDSPLHVNFRNLP
jgi:hypothetical protein